jgi:hypothetical protein
MLEKQQRHDGGAGEYDGQKERLLHSAQVGQEEERKAAPLLL